MISASWELGLKKEKEEEEERESQR